MRRTLAVLATATALALGGGVVTAESADARRNLGGTQPQDAICYTPGGDRVRADRAVSLLDCFCYIDKFGTSNCPPGVVRQESRPDRNLGG